MPLSEFHRAAGKKLDCTQSKMTTCTSDVSSFMPDYDFIELLWENGQIVMQGQSNKLKKSSYPTPFPSHSLRAQEKGGRDPAIQKFSQFEALDTTVNELLPAVPCAGLNAQDDDMSPWINYQMEDPLCSEFFSELAGISSNPPSTERSNSFAVKDFHNVENGHSSKALRESSEPGRLKSNHLLQSPPPPHCQSLAANGKSRLTGFSVGGSGTTSTHQGQLQKQDLGSGSKNLQGSSGIGLMNFSHFLKPASFARADTESLGRLKRNEKVSSAMASTNPIESTLIESSGVRGNSGLDLHKVETRSAAKGKGDVVSVEQQRSEAICHEDALRNNHQNNSVANNNGTSPDRHISRQSSSFAASVAVGRQEAEKGPVAVVASSVCSGDSAGAAWNDPKLRAKRKNREGEESVYHSEDLDDDSIGLKKPAAGQAGTSTKRSRAAEVHNLSERRRRDRINEKMRALQELIPNCNKVDKASMLDEAIEYLKTLQLQVQMMSMGSGLCMPPMMLPPGMQHFRTPHMAHFSPVGVGMGLGLSYGMGMLDMNGSPMIPVPSMHTPQFPCSSVTGASGLHGIPGSTGLQLFGIPGHGQGLPLSMLRAPHFSPMSGLAAKGSPMNEESGAMVNPLPASDAGSSPRCKDQPQQQQCINLESAQKPSNSEPQVAKESFEHAQLLQIGNQALQANGNANTGNASYG